MTETSGFIPQEPKRKVNLLNALALLLLSLGIGLTIYIIYLVSYPFNPLTIKSVTITTPTIKAGGTLIYKINSCKHTRETPVVYRKIVSKTSSQSFPTTQGVVQPGCNTTQVPIQILADTPPGKYMLYTEVVYQVNPLRAIHVFWSAGPFMVTN